MDFSSIKSAFDAMICQDASLGTEQNQIAFLKSEQFQQLAGLLLATNCAERAGNKLVITDNGDDTDNLHKMWLYKFVQSTMNRDVNEMVKYQKTWFKLPAKENGEEKKD
jgi:hypothetical protein